MKHRKERTVTIIATSYSYPTNHAVIKFFTLLAIFLTFHLTLHSQLPWESDSPKREIRAVGVTTLNGLDWPQTQATSQSGIEQQKRELCQILDLLKKAHINTVLLQTRIRGSVIFPSSIEPWDACLTGSYDKNPGYDPLAFAIEETHRRGMELHAWVVTIPAFKVEVAKRMGKRSLMTTHPELLKKHNGQYYLDPGLPGTADYLSSLIADFIDKYDIDGIHFDYIRYPENSVSFPDGQTYKEYGRGRNKAEWRRDNITNIVRRLYKEVKARKPWVVMSSSPVGKYRDTKRYSSRGWNSFDAVHQDAQGWLREGIQDALLPMMYFTGDHFYPFAVDWYEGCHERYVAPGLGIYFLHPNEKNWNLSVITRELSYLRRQGLTGQAFFRSRFLTDNVKGIYDYLQKTFYPYPALPPHYHWLSNIPPEKPNDFTLRTGIGDMVTLEWQPTGDKREQQGGLRYNVYASTLFPVDTERAENLVASLLPEPQYTYSLNTIIYNKLYLAVTAIDRFGNESEAAQLAPPEYEHHKLIPLNPLGKPVEP